MESNKDKIIIYFKNNFRDKIQCNLNLCNQIDIIIKFFNFYLYSIARVYLKIFKKNFFY